MPLRFDGAAGALDHDRRFGFGDIVDHHWAPMPLPQISQPVQFRTRQELPTSSPAEYPVRFSAAGVILLEDFSEDGQR